MVWLQQQKSGSIFLKLGMPVSEVNQIIRDSILLGQTHNFINQWGLRSIQANTKYSGIFF